MPGAGSGYEFASRRVTRVLDAIIAECGRPAALRCDNGPEFTSRYFLAWAGDRADPYSAGQADAERAHRKFSRTAAGREFASELFQNLFDAKRKIAAQDRGLTDRV
jgi:hypothetical protein